MIKEFGVIFSSLFILILLFSLTISFNNNFNALAQNSTVSNLPPNTTSTISGVKIISPEKGSTVPINLNSPFIVKGISKDTTTTNCQVLVIVNNVKPYQNAQPMNKNGNEDFSQWQFTLTKNYTNIIEGSNKITSKFSCLNNPQSSHYSVNVTGVNFTPEQLRTYYSTVVSNATAPVVSNATAPVVSNATAPVVSNATAPVVSAITNQQPISQILAPNENSQSDPICCKTIDNSGGSSSNAGSSNSAEIARAAAEEEEEEIAKCPLGFYRNTDGDCEEVTSNSDDDDEIARAAAEEEEEEEDDEITEFFLDDFFDEMEFNLQSAGIN
nr:hypothetical protein [Nitrosopumilus sp.]